MAKIAFIDDDPLLTGEFRRELKAKGYTVSYFTGVDEFLTYLKGRPPIDLFVVDLVMKPGVKLSDEDSFFDLETGVSLSRLIRNAYNVTPILVFTGIASNKAQLEAGKKVAALGNAALILKSDFSRSMSFAGFVEMVLSDGADRATKSARLSGEGYSAQKVNPLIWFPTAVSAALICTGVYFLFIGAQSKTEIKIGSWSIATSSVGMLLVVLAALVFLIAFLAIARKNNAN
jgi:CheY-like chemotaxis protein